MTVIESVCNSVVSGAIGGRTQFSTLVWPLTSSTTPTISTGSETFTRASAQTYYTGTEYLTALTTVAGFNASNGIYLAPATTNKCECYSLPGADQYGVELASGSLDVGKRYEITAQSIVDFTTAGAVDNIIGTAFTCTLALTMTADDKAKEIGGTNSATGAFVSGLGVGVTASHNGATFDNPIPGVTMLGDVAGHLDISYNLAAGFGDSFSVGNPNSWLHQLNLITLGKITRNGISGGLLTGNILADFGTDIANDDFRGAIIQGGINDIFGGKTAAQILDAVANACDIAVAAGVDITLINIGPWKAHAGWSVALQTITDDYNTGLAAYATANSFGFVDIYTGLEDVADTLNAAYDSGDGLHPNLSGSQVIANLIYPEIDDTSPTGDWDKLFVLDNLDGAAAVTAVITGDTANTNKHSLAVLARVEANDTGYLAFSPFATGSLAITNSSVDLKKVEDKTPNNIANKCVISATAGAIVYFRVPVLEENTFSSGLNVTNGAAHTENKTELSIQAAGNWPEVGGSSLALDWTPTGIKAGVAECILSSYTDANNWVAVWKDAANTTMTWEKRVAGVSKVATVTVTASIGNTYHLEPTINKDNTFTFKVDGVVDTVNDTDTTAPVFGTNIEVGAINKLSNQTGNIKLVKITSA